MKKLIEILIDLCLKPKSGFGETVIKWHEGKIVLYEVKEQIKP